MTERDPRTDPQRGDMLRLNGRQITVLGSTTDSSVTWKLLASRKGTESDATTSVEMWRRLMKAATVLTRAQEP